MIATVFARLANGVASGVASKAGGAALGWVLSAFGLSDDNELLRRDLDEIKKTLDQLTSQVTQLQAQVERTGFDTQASQTKSTIGQIDHAMSDLALLANLPASDPTTAAFAETVVRDYIGSHLLDAPEILNQHLSSNVPLSGNLIKSASRLVSTRDPFFDSRSSDQVKSVYDYFAAYQAELAILLVEYYHAKPDRYSPTVVKANLDRIEGNVTAQAGSLKPRVPEGTVLETQGGAAGRMWMQSCDCSGLRSLGEIAALEERFNGAFTYLDFRLTNAATSSRVPGLPFGNWEMPTAEDLYKLLSYRSAGEDGVEMLKKRRAWALSSTTRLS